MEHAGVPISIISKWAGHYDSAFTQKTYVHASDEDLQRGQAAPSKLTIPLGNLAPANWTSLPENSAPV